MQKHGAVEKTVPFMNTNDDSHDEHDNAQFIPASRSLQKKAGGPKGQFSKYKIEAAQAKINERADAFMAEIGVHVTKLREAYALLNSGGTDEKAAKAIAMHAREVKGLSGTFGFDLLTQIGDSLYEFASDLKSLNQKRIGLIGAHIDAIEFVVQHNIVGDGGQVARELLQTLGIASDKLSDH